MTGHHLMLLVFVRIYIERRNMSSGVVSVVDDPRTEADLILREQFKNSDGVISCSDIRFVYVVLENDYSSTTLHGVYRTLAEAAAHANREPGADVYKAELGKEPKKLECRVVEWEVYEHRENPDQNPKLPRLLPRNNLKRFTCLENAKQYIREYAKETYTGTHDRATFIDYGGHGYRADIHTSRVNNHGPNEFLVGGFHIGTLQTEAKAWEYHEGS